MTQTIVHKPISENWLTNEQVWDFVFQIRARTELLKHKKDNFTLEEERIRINGERALRAIVKDFYRLIWAVIHRFNVSDRFTFDEMYCIAVRVVEHAANSHNPIRGKRQKSFSGWVFMQLRQHFMRLFRDEFAYIRRNKAAYNNLKNNACFSNDKTPLKVLLEEDFREQIEQIVTASFSERRSEIFKEYYLNEEPVKNIAIKLGISRVTVETNTSKVRKQLRENPQFRELAEAYLA
jgi:RNA polymerase sigma factor (sigma-70 family)